MVIWSIPARNDLKRIYDYIARDSKFYATKVMQDIVKKSEQLNVFPKSGRIVPETYNPNIREVFTYSYRLIYRVSPGVVKVLALIHSKQEFLPGDLGKSRK